MKVRQLTNYLAIVLCRKGSRPLPLQGRSLNASGRRHAEGLTLIEVLIALAIIAIAMTAIIKASSQNIKGTAYLQDKTLALWAAEQTINEIRLGLVSMPEHRAMNNQVKSVLGRDWYVNANQESTPNPKIKKINVSVFNKPSDDEGASPMLSLETYVY